MGRQIRTDSKFILKLLFLALTLLFIFSRVVNRSTEIELTELRNSLDSEHSGALFISALLLMFVNISIEAMKWRYVTRDFVKLDLIQSLKAVTAGFSFGMFTPNRTGEFVGRIAFLSAENRPAGIAASAVLSITQLTWTIFAGIASLVLMRKELQQVLFLKWTNIFWWSASILFIASVALMLLFKTPVSEKFRSIYMAVKSIRKASIIKLLALSALRYIVFTVQFVIIMKLFGVDLELIHIAGAGSVFFLLSSAVPSFLFSEIPVRGTVAVLVFSPFAVAEESVFAGSAVLWLMNIAIPAIIGIFALIFRKK